MENRNTNDALFVRLIELETKISFIVHQKNIATQTTSFYAVQIAAKMYPCATTNAMIVTQVQIKKTSSY